LMVMCEPTFMVTNVNCFVSYDTCCFQTFIRWYISCVCH
jgi:hypothetical protein